VGDDNIPAATITFPTVGVVVKDLSKTPSATNGSVSRLDPRGLEREASHLPHVAALRGLLIVRFTAIVGAWYQETVGGQMFRVSKTADVSHLGQNRVGQDPGDTGNRPEPITLLALDNLLTKLACHPRDLTTGVIKQL
jgi:hypothetical protein